MNIANTILSFMAAKLVEWLLKRIEKAVQKYASEVAKDDEQNAVNGNNLKKYEDANDRKKRIEVALELLNHR